MNTTLLWLLALPIFIALVIFIIHRKYQVAIAICAGYALASLVIIGAMFMVSKGVKTMDTEIWNGQITSKSRVHGEYQQSYQCNCTSSRDSSGNTTTTCQTCYEDHYTVKWSCESTVGGFTIKSLDKTTKRVYNTPDPDRYTVIQPGDPAARQHGYTNYVQAVPNSLFTPAAADLKEKFKPLLPKYPIDVYDFYKLDRFITIGGFGGNGIDHAAWNEDISNGLRVLGPKKQVNVIVVIAKTNDPNYEYALRDAWEGVNKNDVVLIIGSTEYPKIDFVRVLSWTKSEIFKIGLRDAVMEKGVIDRDIVPLMMAQIEKNFERRHMKEFEYLDGEIDPPDWMIYLILTLVIGGAIGAFIMIPKIDTPYRRF